MSNPHRLSVQIFSYVTTEKKMSTAKWHTYFVCVVSLSVYGSRYIKALLSPLFFSSMMLIINLPMFQITGERAYLIFGILNFSVTHFNAEFKYQSLGATTLSL